MYYHQHLPERRPRQYLMPFFTILIIAGIIVAGWQGLKAVFLEDFRNIQSEQARLSIENGGVKAMAVDSADWKSVPDKIALYEGEKLKTVGDGRATLTFSDQSVLRLDGESEIFFETLKRKKEAPLISLKLQKGRFWARVARINNPEAQFRLNTEWLKIESRDTLMAVEAPGSVYVLEGNARVAVMEGEEALKTYTVGVGQQFMITQEGIAKLTKEKEVEVIFALSDSFKTSSWYSWNTRRDSGLPAEESAALSEEISGTAESVTADSASSLVTISGDSGAEIKKPLLGDFTNKSAINVEGIYDASKVQAVYVQGKKASLNANNQWVAGSVVLSQEGENRLTVEVEDLQGKKTALKPLTVNYDRTPPLMPQLKKPGKGGESVTLDSVDVVISGSVGKDTHAVIVNDYRLQKYVSGNMAFEYYAKASIGNLKVGQNEYKIYAEDKAGNRSEPATLTLVLPQEVYDRLATSTTPIALGSGGVTITTPNNGQNFTTTETEFLLQGAVPKETAKVMVNDYALTKYDPGQTTWSYKASKSLGSLVIGQKNTYTVKAYDAENVLLGSATLTIDVESGGAPVITIPTEKTSYLTTLDELVIGGTVGKWVDSVYVNDKKLLNYIPGSEKWNYTVVLKPGSTTFRVYGERDGQNTAADEIEIIYQP